MLSRAHAPSSLAVHERMNTLRGLSRACSSLLRPSFAKPRPSQRRMPYIRAIGKTAKATAGQPSTSATENKDHRHHERASAPASLLQYSRQNASSRCNIEPAAFQIRAVATDMTRSQRDGARVKEWTAHKGAVTNARRDLRNDKNLIGPRIFYFAAGSVTAHIDISLIGVKGTEHVAWFARDCLGSREFRLGRRGSSLGRWF